MLADLHEDEPRLGGDAAVEAVRERPFPQATTDVIMPCQLETSASSRSSRRRRAFVMST
jgi:hypothetical protein